MKDSAAAAADAGVVVAVVAAVVEECVGAEAGGADSAVVRPVADFPAAGGLLPDLEGVAVADESRVAAPIADRRTVHRAEVVQEAVSPAAVVRAACNPDRAREWGSETGRRLVPVEDPESASCLPAGSVEVIDRESVRVRASAQGSVQARGRESVRELLPERGQGRCRVSEPGPVWGVERVSEAEIEDRTCRGRVKIAPPVCRIAWPMATA